MSAFKGLVQNISVVNALIFGRSPSKHPFASVEKWLSRSGQSEEASANARAAHQSLETNAGEAATVQLPRLLRDDHFWSQIAGEQKGLIVLQARLSAQRQNVW